MAPPATVLKALLAGVAVWLAAGQSSPAQTQRPPAPVWRIAQLQLPGAFTPAPAGAVVGAPDASPLKKTARKAASAPPARAPDDDAVLGRTLMLNGRAGALEFKREGKALAVARLKLPGEQMSHPGELCEVDVGGPLGLVASGKPTGAQRYRIAMPACPIALDVLSGAVLMVTDGASCAFTAADCRVDPAGLWGQPASEIGPQRAKEIESERTRAEKALRGQFRAWIKEAGKDSALVSRIAREQAAFSSKREELCRAYARETQHGYCAMVATEARSLSVSARTPPAPAPDEDAALPKKPRR